MAEAKKEDKLGITVITGFLGSGKTTLLNRILSETHGLKLAVIENEFGEVGIDDALVKQAISLDGQNDIQNVCLEMNNGCICCTVRADMAKAVASMLERHRSGKKLDGIIIETTGMADPAPVVQTFFVDKNLSSGVFLDGVITVVDAKHINSHLHKKDGEEAFQQISYADRVILNKTDLVTTEELSKVNDEIYRINSSAMILETIRSKVDIKKIMNIRAFELERILKTVDAEFLETNNHHDHDHDDHDCGGEDSCGHHSHGHGHGHGHGQKEGHGHGHKKEDGHGHGHKKEDGHGHGHKKEDGHGHGHKKEDGHGHGHKKEDGHGDEHKKEDGHGHGHKKEDGHGHGHKKEDGHGHGHKKEDGHGHGHKEEDGHDHGHKKKEHKHAERRKSRHSSKVNSVAIVKKGDIDYDVLVDWLTEMLQEEGQNIYRMKGVLNMEDEDGMFVLQGVHQLWDLEPVGRWAKPCAERVNKVVFIGKSLDRTSIEIGFESCIKGTAAHAEAREHMEQLWRVQAFWETQHTAADALREEQLSDEKQYEVSVHNGLYGMGMLLSERQGDDGRPCVYVAGFAKMPQGIVNNAVETGLIVTGDSLLSCNGTSLKGLPLKDVITILRRLPRGAGVTGTTAKLVLEFGPDADEIPFGGAAAAEPTKNVNASMSWNESKVVPAANSTKRKAGENESQMLKKRKVWKG